ncbi:MAG: elongation factor 4 [Candidatus Woykebacteria bacterium RBG_13_40_15]|uniref:Elongation factor 4 n=1 Tax=Candidatus Woykebacteria bacterium RBG_13_40_15 TaxID=1802593 RepID=A0A1G1W945_9BACT|nr:MAG: elongation factor 4 [Candidatus Woykebacteria bacterium RBG_13_40_15]
MKNIRNLSIIAHIDHGKSTLADRFLEITNTIPKDELFPQYLDQLDLERERGITIKLAPVTMNYRGVELNLIDTPGHADFSYEVSRSLSCVEGAILLVDATKGIEAQTLSHLFLAEEQQLKIIPVLNKIDLPEAQIEEVKKQLKETLGFSEEEIYSVSAKTGEGVDALLETIIEKIPTPKESSEESLRALIFDSVYDSFKGAIAYVRIFDGGIKSGEQIKFLANGEIAQSSSVGYFAPQFKEGSSLESGQIGWIATGFKEVSKVSVGDTITHLKEEAEALPGYRQSKPMVFAGLFPVERDDFPKLKEALEKLKLNDAALTWQPENSPALGFGVRAGFLGLLHMEIVQERLERESDLNLIISAPTVPYKVVKTNREKVIISNPQELPSAANTKEISEPWTKATIVTYQKYLGSITQLLHTHRGQVSNIEYLGDKIKISLEIPLAEIISRFYDQLKTVSSGFASLDYEFSEYRPANLVKLEILIAKEPVDALSQIVVKEKAFRTGKLLIEKLKEAIPRQQFEVSLQAAIGAPSTGLGHGKIIAAEKIPPFRKDVIAKLYGGDRTRKDKLLEKQKEGKRRLKRVGKIDIPQEAFLAALKI